MVEKLMDYFRDKKLLILGFGMEGQSTYQFLRRYLPDIPLVIADRDPDLENRISLRYDDPHLRFISGEFNDRFLEQFDRIIKSPGVVLPTGKRESVITSQTDLVMRFFRKQVIGVTGTKGKSTTASLLSHILELAGKKVVLVGNIGIPPFDLIDQWDQDTCIVYEMSSHQLEFITSSPHIGILLNVYQEHLDHYPSFEAYQSVKLKIFKYQCDEDFHVYNQDDRRILSHLKRMDISSTGYGYSLKSRPERGCSLTGERNIVFNDDRTSASFFTQKLLLRGEHNLMNCMAVVCACRIMDVPDRSIQEGLNTFKGLAHRMEYAGTFSGIHFYNDSIATIPEATIHAVRTLKNVDTLILGGYDRGVDYRDLISFLTASAITNLIFIGQAGERMKGMFEKDKAGSKRLLSAKDYAQAMMYAGRFTSKDTICLLSPAAASYDMFRDFRERGEVFCALASKL